MRSEAEISLILRAKDMAEGEIAKLKGSLDGLVSKAQLVTSKLKTMGRSLGRDIGTLVTSIASGGDVGQAFAQMGMMAAGQFVGRLAEGMILMLVQSSFVQALIPIVTSIGTAIGGFMAAAVPVGMALLPVLLVAALVAAVAFLIMNPDIVAKIADFAGSIISTLVGFLAKLPGAILDVIVGAFRFAGDIVGKVGQFALSIIGGIIGGLLTFPAELSKTIARAFQSLKIDVGPFHIRASGVTIDLPDISAPATGAVGQKIGRHASGGWVGLHGPELSWLGEKGPEYVVPNGGGTGGGGGGFSIKGVSEREIIDMVDRGLYFRLQRSALTESRT